MLKDKDRLGSADFTFMELADGLGKPLTRALLGTKSGRGAITLLPTEDSLERMEIGELLRVMERGETFKLFDSDGNVEELDVFLVNASYDKSAFGSLYWDEVGRRRVDEARRLELSHIVDMYEGKQTAALAHSAAKDAPTHHCFSLKTKDGDWVNLESQTHRTRDLYMRGVFHLVTTVGRSKMGVHGVVRETSLLPPQEEQNETKIGSSGRERSAPTPDTPMHTSRRRIRARGATSDQIFLRSTMAQRAAFPIATQGDYELEISCKNLPGRHSEGKPSPVVGVFKADNLDYLFLDHTDWLASEASPSFTQRIPLRSHPDDGDRIRVGVYDAEALLVLEQDTLGSADYSVEELLRHEGKPLSRLLTNTDDEKVNYALELSGATVSVTLRRVKGEKPTASMLTIMEQGR